MKTPIFLLPEETCLKLKKIGFDKKVHHFFMYYHGWKILKQRGDEYGFYGSDSTKLKSKEDYNGEGLHCKISAPTYEEVFDWFREKGIYGGVNGVFSQRAYSGNIFFGSKYRKTITTPINEDYYEVRKEVIDKMISKYCEINNIKIDEKSNN